MKAIVSVIGKDRTGIIAKVTGKLFELGCNVEDISQTVMHGSYFTMIMLITLADGEPVRESERGALLRGGGTRRGDPRPARGHLQLHAQDLTEKLCSTNRKSSKPYQ